MLFYVKNKDEETVTTLSDDVVLHDSSPLISANLTEILNGLQELSIETLANKEDTVELKEENSILFKDGSEWKEFIIDKVEDTDSSDAPFKEVIATISAVELNDDIIKDDLSSFSELPKVILGKLLENTRWSVGYVDSGIASRKFTEETEHLTVLEGVFLLAKNYECDVYFSYEVDAFGVTKRKVNLFGKLGSDIGKRFEIDKDVTEISRTVDTTSIKTAIIPLGKEIESEDGSKNRVTIESVNGGKDWLGDEEARVAWGKKGTDGKARHRFLFMEFDIDKPQALKDMAWVQLKRYTSPKVTYEAKVIDLFRLTGSEDYRHESVKLGDTVAVIDRYFSNPIETISRVVEIERDLLLPDNDNIVLGNHKSSYSTDFNRIKEVTSDISRISRNTTIAIDAANGKNRNYYGSKEPNKLFLKEGDLWFKPNPDKPDETLMLQWNGQQWIDLFDTADVAEAKEKADKAIEDAGFNRIEVDKLKNEIIDVSTTSDKALKEAEEARIKAFNSEQIANSAKSDAITAIAKGDHNSTEISKIDTEVKATAIKVEGNTAELAQLKIESGKISSTVGKVEADLAGINVGVLNLASSKQNGTSSKPSDYWFIGIAEAKTQSAFTWKPDTEYTIVMNGRVFEEGSILRWYLQHPPSYDLNQNDSIKSLVNATTSKTFRTPKWENPETASLNIYNYTKTGGVYLNWIMVFEGNKAPKEYIQSQYELTTKQEFSTFEQTVKGFQQTVNSDIDGVKSQQTQMAGQISSTIETVNSLDSASTNLLLDSLNRVISPRGFNGGWSRTENIVVDEWKTDKAKNFKGSGSTERIFGTISSGKNSPNNTTRKGFDYVWAIYIRNNHSSNSLLLSNNAGSTQIIKPKEVKRVIMKGIGNGGSFLQLNFVTETAGEAVDFDYFQPMIAEGNVVSAWSPAPEDSASKSEVLQLSDQIIQTVTRVETIDGKVSTQQTQITQLDNRITSIAKETTDLSTKYSKIEQTTDALRTQVVDMGEAVANIGTYVNYLVNVDQFSNSLPYTIGMSGPVMQSVDGTVMEKGKLQLFQRYNNPGWYWITDEKSTLERGVEYTFSGNFEKFDLNVDIELIINQSSTPSKYLKLSQNQDFEFTFTVPVTGKWGIRFYTQGLSRNYSFFRKLKLNKGNKRVENTVDTASLNARISSIEQKTDGITAEVKDLKYKVVEDKLVIDGEISRVEQKANGISSEVAVIKNDQITQSSQITQLSNQINLRVEKDKVVNQINISTEGILISGNKVHISGQTKIDNAVIKSAMIKDINADTIVSGTLRAVDIEGCMLTSVGNSYKSKIVIDSGRMNFYLTQTTGTKYAGTIGTTAENSSSAGPYGGPKMTVSIGAESYFTLTSDKISDSYLSIMAKEGIFTINYLSSLELANKSKMWDTDNTSHGKQMYIAGIEGVSIGIQDRLGLFSGKNYMSIRPYQLSIKHDSEVYVTSEKITFTSSDVRVLGNFSVTGNKNAIHVTRDGVRATPAYELAESYLGDIGTSVTDSTGKSVVYIEELFSDTVNTDQYEYHVFIQSYEKNVVFSVTERNALYFIVVSNKPNSKFVYEIKARRRGYEKDRLVLSNYVNSEIEELFRG